MKINDNIKTAIMGGILFLVMNTASALGQVSRACQFSTLPNSIKPIAVAFFYAVGADPDVLLLPTQSADVQATKWILESLTTDYGQVRYLLFATRVLYAETLYDFVQKKVTYTNQHQAISSTWTAEQISDSMKADPKFSYYYLNRGTLYSARAGNPKIIDTNPDTTTSSLSALNYLVTGLHWYYDPLSKSIVRLADTETNTCNLPDMGAGTGLFNR